MPKHSFVVWFANHRAHRMSKLSPAPKHEKKKIPTEKMHRPPHIWGISDKLYNFPTFAYRDGELEAKNKNPQRGCSTIGATEMILGGHSSFPPLFLLNLVPLSLGRYHGDELKWIPITWLGVFLVWVRGVWWMLPFGSTDFHWVWLLF